MATRDDLTGSSNSAEEGENYDKIPFKFEITGNISKIGITGIVLDRDNVEFIITPQNRCYIPFISNKTTLSKLCHDIKKKLSKKLESRINDAKTFELAISDIEDQIIENRDRVLNASVKDDNINENNISEDDKYKIKFKEDVLILRKKFEESPNPYKEWQSKVAEKYDVLRKIMEMHYPEAWPMMEFCLSVKSILNVLNLTLPFMGVIVAPPASMKTMVIQLFRKYPNTFYTDSFTPSSLVSHNAALTEEQLEKVDMLPKMKDKVVLVPEMAPLFTANDDDLQKVMGIITRINDGHGLENDSGAHGHRKYGDTMFVCIGAVVEIPPRIWKLLGTLGHKIYFLRPSLRKKTIWELKKIAKNNNFSAINKEIEDALLDYLKTFDAAPEINGKIKIENNVVKIKWNEGIEEGQDKSIEHIAQLANMLASLRGTVSVSQSKYVNHKNYNENNSPQQPRQADGQDYDTDIPTTEIASRATILLRNLAIGHAISQGRDHLILEDVPIAVEVALSTSPIRRVKLLDLLIKSDNGELTTSQITTRLSVSQPVATRTMREFDALGIADISAVGEYGNSELVIKLRQEFEWFRSEEFLKLKGDFVPSGKDKGDSKLDNDGYGSTGDCNKNNDSDSQTVVPIALKEDILLCTKDKEQDISCIQDTIEPCDNDKDCHTLKENLPPEAQQKNNVSSTTGDNTDTTLKQTERHQQQKDDDADLNQQLSNNNNNNNESQDDNHNNKLIKTAAAAANTPDKHNTEKRNLPLWGSKSFERVTVSQEDQNCLDPNEASLSVKGNDHSKDPTFYIALQEILNSIKFANGSIISVNSAIESAHRNNELVRNYLGEKLTSRENRKVLDLNLAIIRHKNIEVVKRKPQLLVRWHEVDQSSEIHNSGETV